MFFILLKNCKLATDEITDILIEKGKISKIGKNIDYPGHKIDIKEKYVLPGLIDPHVHFRHPGASHKEEWKTATKAALKGGYTTVLDMPNTNPSTIDKETLENKRRDISKHSLVNYGFHLGLTNINVKELNKISNVASFKIFMGSSTGSLLVDKDKDLKNIFKNANRLLTIHAEDESIIKEKEKIYKNQSNPFIHAKIRSIDSAKSAVKKALKLAKKYKKEIYICHTSTLDEIELIAKARKEGVKVYCEATPHHLFMDYHELEKQENFAKMNPPLRRQIDVEALWKGIGFGIVNTIGTDHAPHTIEEKEQNYWIAPSGVPGIENALALMLNAVNEERIPIERVQEIMSENSAKIFGIKNKGKIKKGYDADLVVIDIDIKKKVKNEEQLTKCKWTPYDGMILKGWAVKTIVNGNIVFDNGLFNKEFRGNEVKFDA